jgi:hypothetical protein
MKKILTIFMLTFSASQLSARMIICNVNKSKQVSCYWSAGTCSMGKPPGADYCLDIDPWTGALTFGRVLVLVDDESNGVVQVGDKIVNILPDYLYSLLQIKTSDEINNIQPTKIATKVSKKRFDEIAKELGVKVTKVKKLPKANYCPACEEVDKKKNEQTATINPFESVIIEMVCDCNPSQVLSTFVTNANGKVNIKVPRDANYSFKLVMPPVLKDKGIKMAALSNDVVVNFIGGKNIENLSFNAKGVASAKNLQQGNYEIALSRKPPKGGPNGPSGPPRGKCPPGETPWLGGCIPIVVVGGLNKVQCPPGYSLIDGVCINYKLPTDQEPVPPRPDGFPNPKNAVDINCPSGKYDANGNCIFGRQAPVNVAQKTKINIGGNVSYQIGSSGVINSKSPFLFFKNGQSAGLDFTIVPLKGTTRFKLAVYYINGTNDKMPLSLMPKRKI